MLTFVDVIVVPAHRPVGVKMKCPLLLMYAPRDKSSCKGDSLI